MKCYVCGWGVECGMGKLCKLLKKFPLELCGATDGLGGGGGGTRHSTVDGGGGDHFLWDGLKYDRPHLPLCKH